MKPREFVEEYCVKSLVCCFSGGKDSLVSTHYVMSELQDVEIDKYVAFVDTTVMVPVAEPFVKDVCSQFGWNLKVLRPEETFFKKVADGMPMPTLHRRWCCKFLKLDPIRDFVRDLKPQRAEVTGLRREESVRRRKLPELYYLKKSRVWKYAPIVAWTDKDVLRHMRMHNLPMPPQYRLGIPETCLCGSFSSKKIMMNVKAHFPDLFQKFVELEKNFKKGGAAFYFKNKPVFARDLAKQKTLLGDG